MLSFVNSFMSWYLRKRIPIIEHATEKPAEVQMQQFEFHLSQIKKTSFGKEYKLNEIKTLEQYRERVPIHTYDQIKPYIQRVMRGEQRVIWPGDIKWFAKSSGTTSDKSKFIPVSFDMLDECQFKGSRDILALYYNDNPNAKVFQGKGVIIGGSHQINELSTNSFYGDLSAVMMNNMPFIANFLATPSMEIALMDDWEEKLEKMTEVIYDEDVTNISGVPTWTLLLINKLFEKGNFSDLMEIWPNLELYVHGGVNFDPYRSSFKDVISSSSMNYRETYNASEGFFGIQDSAHENMMMMLDYGIFFEFIKLTEIDNPNAKTYWIDDVEIGVCYGVLINSNAGLCRYHVGDTITFTSKKPLRFIINGRTKHFINAFGEELMIHNAEAAIASAQEKTSSKVSEFTAAPVYLTNTNKGRHQWAIEFFTEPTDIELFSSVLDEELQKRNSDYEAKRQSDLALLPPLIEICPKGTFHQWLKSKEKLGGQHKVPRLVNDRTIITEILALINT